MYTRGVVLITGCSSGFGFKSALKFAQHGYQTYASVRNLKSEGTFKLREIVEQEHLPIQIIQIDVADDNSAIKGVQSILKAEKNIDILVNNAGWAALGSIEEYSVSEVIDQYQTNILGMLRMVKAVAPVMRRHHQGLIINLSSMNGLIPFPLMGIYSSSKYAIETLTEILRFELSHFGVKVTQIEPGLFLTGEYSQSGVNRSQAALNRDSPYKSFADASFNRANHAKAILSHHKILSRIFNAQKVVDLIYAISQTNHPRSRYRIGLDVHLYYLAKRLLPDSIWEWLLHRIYNW